MLCRADCWKPGALSSKMKWKAQQTVDGKYNFPGIQSIHWAQEKDLASWKGVTRNWVIFKPRCFIFSFETVFWDKHSVKFNYSSVNKYIWSTNTLLLKAERLWNTFSSSPEEVLLIPIADIGSGAFFPNRLCQINVLNLALESEIVIHHNPSCLLMQTADRKGNLPCFVSELWLVLKAPSFLFMLAKLSAPGRSIWRDLQILLVGRIAGWCSC